MKQINSFLDGKKTISGVILLIAGMLGICDIIPKEDLREVVELTINVVGSILTLVGLIHKIYKAYDERK